MDGTRGRAWPLLDLIYDAPGNEARWSDALAGLADALSGSPCIVVAAHLEDGERGRIYANGIDTSGIGADEKWFKVAPVESDPEETSVCAVLPVPEGAPALIASPLFRMVLEQRGVQPGPGLYVTLATRGSYQVAAMLILPTDEPYLPTEADTALVKELAPHIARALELQMKLDESAVTTEALLAAMDRLVLGVLLLDEDGRVSYANRSVAEALRIEPGVSGPGRSERVDPRTEAFRRIVSMESGSSEGGLVYPHPEDGRPLQVLFAPMRWDENDAEATRRYATAIFMSDPNTDSGEPVQLFGSLYGLTPAESRLAIMLLADHSLEASARNLGVTVGTARTTLKRVFAKTGTNRQASLVRLLLRGSGQIRPD